MSAPTLLRESFVGKQGRLPAPVAFVLLASLLVFFLAASSAPTPLYGTYQAMWHFSPITTTAVFGTYALSVLLSLLFVGRLSDHVGRRPVLLAAVALQFPAMLLLSSANGVGELFGARLLQGIATGAAAGAIGAGLLDINAKNGTLANSVAAPIGTASGALIGGLFVQFLPAPLHLVYLVLLAIFIVQFIGLLFMSETVTRKPGALQSLRPEFAVPKRARGPLFAAIPALIAGWSLAGLYGSLAPSVVQRMAHSHSLLLGAMPLFIGAGFGAIAIVFGRNRVPAKLMRYAAVALVVGVGLTLAATEAESVALFFVGTAIAGTGFGASFQAAVRTVVPLAHPHERAGVLSVLYTVSYLALGLPAVIAGWLVVHEGGLMQTMREYTLFVRALGVLALVASLRQERGERVALDVLTSAERERVAACSLRRGGEVGLVQQRVARRGVALRRAADAVQAGEAPARLGDDRDERGHVPEREFRLSREIDGPLGDQHVRVEVAVGAASPAPIDQSEKALAEAAVLPSSDRGVRDRCVLDAGNLRDAKLSRL